MLIRAYVVGFVLTAGALMLVGDWSSPTPDTEKFLNALVAFGVLGVASEAAFLRLSVGTSTSSVSYIPSLAAVVLLGPSWAMMLAAVAMFTGEAVVRRKPALKVAFNVANATVAVGVAGYLFEGLGGARSLSVVAFDPAPAAFGVAVAAYFVINSGSTAVAVAISSSTGLRASMHRLVGSSLLFDLLSTPLALLLAYLYWMMGLVGVLVVVVPLFLVRHVHSVNLRLEEANRDLLELMVKAIEARDPYTSGHSVRVARVAGVLARQLGLGAKQIEETETAALLHDVGKIHEEYAPLLRKEGKLNAGERALMQTHALRSYELIRTISSFRNGLDLAVRHHHENFDGSGYPDGLQGEDIPLASRIIMVADTADAMTTDRPYRVAIRYEQVVLELRKYSGSQFDPQVVDAFIRSSEIRRLVDGTRNVDPALTGDRRVSHPGIAYVG